MGKVDLTVNGRSYTLACDDGEERHLVSLARYFNRHVDDLTASVGQVGEARLILMAALTVADELSRSLQQVKALEEEIQTLQGACDASVSRAEDAEAAATTILEQAARRIDHLADMAGSG